MEVGRHEVVATTKAFRALTNESSKLNYKHHPKFRSPWEIVNHIGPHGRECFQAATEGRMDLIDEGQFDLKGPNIYSDPEAAAKSVENYSAKLIDALKNVSDEAWETKIIPVYWGPMKIMDLPLMKECWMMNNDTIHHRGQLSSYYRPIGLAQPGFYGPTAEEEEAMMAAK